MYGYSGMYDYCFFPNSPLCTVIRVCTYIRNLIVGKTPIGMRQIVSKCYKFMYYTYLAVRYGAKYQGGGSGGADPWWRPLHRPRISPRNTQALRRDGQIAVRSMGGRTRRHKHHGIRWLINMHAQ